MSASITVVSHNIIIVKNIPRILPLNIICNYIKCYFPLCIIKTVLPIWCSNIVFIEFHQTTLFIDNLVIDHGMMIHKVCNFNILRSKNRSTMCNIKYIALQERDFHNFKTYITFSSCYSAYDKRKVKWNNTRKISSNAIQQISDKLSELGVNWKKILIPINPWKMSKENVYPLRRNYIQLIYEFDSMNSCEMVKNNVEGCIIIFANQVFIIRTEFFNVGYNSRYNTYSFDKNNITPINTIDDIFTE
uniref:Uncharacterized protein n=1 Tax=viral metagenome TaxID=1070528 RepID=A0A6C0LKT1_9ZZZZ